MPKEPPRILAVNPGSRYVGLAAFRGPELLDWGVRVVRARTTRGRIRAGNAIFVEAVERYHPDTLAIKRLHCSRSSSCLDGLTSSIQQLARRRRLQVRQYTIGQLKTALCPEEKANKRRLAEAIAILYPVLTHDFRRETTNRNPYYVRMFEAVALGIVCHRHLENVENN